VIQFFGLFPFRTIGLPHKEWVYTYKNTLERNIYPGSSKTVKKYAKLVSVDMEDKTTGSKKAEVCWHWRLRPTLEWHSRTWRQSRAQARLNEILDLSGWGFCQDHMHVFCLVTKKIWGIKKTTCKSTFVAFDIILLLDSNYQQYLEGVLSNL